LELEAAKLGLITGVGGVEVGSLYDGRVLGGDVVDGFFGDGASVVIRG
jgi:hypothetical protein